jgi:hypothetical protein
MDGKIISGAGFALLVIAFLVFLSRGNVAPAILILALGVVFVVAGEGTWRPRPSASGAPGRIVQVGD